MKFWCIRIWTLTYCLHFTLGSQSLLITIVLVIAKQWYVAPSIQPLAFTVR